VLQARLTSSEIAKRAGIPQGSINFYVASGLLEPSIQRGQGKGHPNVFGFRDLVIAIAISKMRLPNISAQGMQKICAFWRSLEDDALRTLIHDPGVDAKKEDVDAGQVLLLLDDGRLVVDENLRILDLTQKYGSSVVHVVDAGQLAGDAFLDLTSDVFAAKFVQPGPSGRIPRGRKPAKTPSNKKVGGGEWSQRQKGERRAGRDAVRVETKRKGRNSK
jgi:DNA-binding transcriptional MerR regulator